MASRRTRIKGIANIPQRRKTSNEENAKLSPEIKNEKEEDPNLNLKHEVPENDKNGDEILPKDEKVKLDIDGSVQSIRKTPKLSLNGENELSMIAQESVATYTTEIKKESIKNEDLSNDDCRGTDLLEKTSSVDLNGKDEKLLGSSFTPKGASHDMILKVSDEANVAIDVKLEQKPTVPARRKFLKPTVSVNAISRKPKDVEEVKFTVVNGSVVGRNSKIVILNEVISYPDQNHHILIQNHKTEGSEISTPQNGNIVYKTPEIVNNVYKSPEVTNSGRIVMNSFERDIRRLPLYPPQILTPDTDYPIPPPSPNKINRSRIKAVPRLGQRNTSISASESEDESRRNYRHRNDSVCSSASGIQDTSSIPECLSPQKPKEFNSVIQRKCRRTEQSRKLAEARRDFYLKFGNTKPDRQKLTMIDLIFYNPVTNPMTSDTKKRKISESEIEKKEEIKVDEEKVDDPDKVGSDEENEMPAPQIKIGPSGEIVVDEQSLVIENKQVKKSREEIEKSEVVNGDFETGYGVYKRAKRSKDWSKKETLKFYKALNTIGTDFALMCELFPRRSRRELKMKFKKEERVNKALVDKAIMQPCAFDFNYFKHEVDMEEKELQELEKQKEREKVLRQEAKKRKASSTKKEPPEKQPKPEKPKQKKKKALDILNVLDDSDADESEVESVEDDETEDVLLKTIQRPTRSGRVPKILNRYEAPEPESKSCQGKAEPGSLIVVAGVGPNGQPVYKVCMVTGKHGRQQIGGDMTSLEKALERKENGITSLFTLTATTTEEEAGEEVPENNQTIPAEENITIPADGVC